jgi:hypothetical protein
LEIELQDPTSQQDSEDLVETWLRYQDLETAEDEWAIFKLQDLLMHDPEQAWTVIVTLMKSASNPWQATMIGASPLEDLLSSNSQYLNRLEEGGPVGAFFQTILEAVWLDDQHLDRRINALRSSSVPPE